MATNYPGSSIQADTMQTLYLMNPSYTGYPDSSASGNMALTNNATGNALGNNNMSGNGQFQTHLIGVTLPTAVSLPSSASPLADTPLLNQSAPSSFLGSCVGDHTFSSWRDGGNEVTFLQPTDSLSNGQSVCALVNNSVHMGHQSIPETPQLALRQQGVFPNDLALHPEQRHHSNGHNHGQCLSLSLSPQQASTVHLLLFQNQTIESDIHHTNISLATSEENRTMDDKGTEKWAGNVGSFQSSPTEEIFGNQLPNTVHRHGPAKQVQPGFNPAGALGVPKILIRSKYLKAAQQLLDEVVNVGKGMKLNSARDFANKEHNTKTSEKDCAAAATAGICLDCGSDLMSAERQELQMKKKKLVTMLDEVDRRYREYYHQMQIIVSLFEAAVSFGAAKTYTALALQTISRHFRCLRDAITGQIHLTNKSLGKEDLTNGKCEISRLHFADQQLRQQKALQQLGMMQHHAWRPQRGLPEHSVSVLRAWLFEHFLHPYPKDTDKHMLAQQTGLTRGQVSNWFINARVRLWKPMVEEMYLDETRESDMDSNASAAKISEVNGENKVPIESKQGAGNSDGQEQKHIRSMEERSCEQQNDLNDRNGTSWMIIVPDSRVLKEDRKQGVTRHGLSKEYRSETQDSPSLLSPRTSMDADLRSEDTQSEDICDDSKYSSERPDAEDCNIFHYTMVNRNPNNNEALGSFQIGTLSRYDPDSFATRFSKSGDVSLTLGLQHCDGFSMSGTEQSYIFSQGLVMGQKQDLDNTSEDYNHSNDTSAIHATNPNESLNLQNRKSLPTHLLHDFVA